MHDASHAHWCYQGFNALILQISPFLKSCTAKEKQNKINKNCLLWTEFALVSVSEIKLKKRKLLLNSICATIFGGFLKKLQSIVHALADCSKKMHIQLQNDGLEVCRVNWKSFSNNSNYYLYNHSVAIFSLILQS